MDNEILESLEKSLANFQEVLYQLPNMTEDEIVKVLGITKEEYLKMYQEFMDELHNNDEWSESW